MTVENRDKRVAFRLTDSEYELLAWASNIRRQVQESQQGQETQTRTL